MRRPPRRKDEDIISHRLIGRVLFSASVIVLGTLFVYAFALHDSLMSHRDQTMVRGFYRRKLLLITESFSSDFHLLRLSRSSLCSAESRALLRVDAEPNAGRDCLDLIHRPALAHLLSAVASHLSDDIAQLSRPGRLAASGRGEWRTASGAETVREAAGSTR